MIVDLLNRMRGEAAPDPLTPENARLALAALLVRVARTDGNYTEVERGMIDRVLIDRFATSPEGASAVRADAEAVEAEAPDTVRFTRMVKDDVPYSDREGVVEALWRVALTDGVQAEERGLLRLVANLLGVSDIDSGLARQRAGHDPEV